MTSALEGLLGDNQSFGVVKQEQEEGGQDALPGMLSRADSGSSTTSDGRAGSLFGSESSSSERRSSFASSVREEPDEEDEDNQYSKSSSSSSYSSISSSFYEHPSDLQTPTMEHGTPASTTVTATPLSLADGLRAIQLHNLAARPATVPLVDLSNSALLPSNPNPGHQLRSISSSSGIATGNSSEGFPWNATKSSSSSNMRSTSSSSTAVGTPSAIFGGPDNVEQEDEDEDEDWQEPLHDVNRSFSSSSGENNARSATFMHSISPLYLPQAGPSTRSSFSSSSSSSKRSPLQSTEDMLATRQPAVNTSALSSSGLYKSSSSSMSGLSSAPASPATVYQPILPSSSSSRSSHFPLDDGPGTIRANKHKSSQSTQLRSSPSQTPNSHGRPSTASSTGSSRPWVKDSDASSVRSTTSAVSSDGSAHDDSQDTLSVMTPAAPPPVPFLSTAPQPVGCKISVDASAPEQFVITASLPGFTLENITLALKRNGSLHILADRYDDSTSSGGGHFERMVELGESAIGSKVSAEFDGKRLRVTVMKRASHIRKQSTGGSSIRSSYSYAEGGSTAAGGKSKNYGNSSRPTTASSRSGGFGLPSPPMARNKSSQSPSSRTTSTSQNSNPFSHVVVGSYGTTSGGQSS